MGEKTKPGPNGPSKEEAERLARGIKAHDEFMAAIADEPEGHELAGESHELEGGKS